MDEDVKSIIEWWESVGIDPKMKVPVNTAIELAEVFQQLITGRKHTQ